MKLSADKVIDIINESIKVKQTLISDSNLITNLLSVSKKITEAFRAGNKLLFCGNGGSAADAQHLAAEFSGRFYIDRDPLPAEALHVNTSYLTAVANDYGYNEVYARIVKASGRPGDILIGLSTSGNSANIIEAFKMARTRGVHTIGFTGITGGQMKEISDTWLPAPSTDTPRIQETHIMMGHIVCQLVEQQLFSSNLHSN